MNPDDLVNIVFVMLSFIIVSEFFQKVAHKRKWVSRRPYKTEKAPNTCSCGLAFERYDIYCTDCGKEVSYKEVADL